MIIGIIAGLGFWAIAVKFAVNGRIVWRGGLLGPSRRYNPATFWVLIGVLGVVGALAIAFGVLIDPAPQKLR
jgi:tellurite resistance protein TehA-like permease